MTKENHSESAKGPETTGHDWDGIQELNNPLPRWWLWTFYITIIWGIAYTIAYPAWPLLREATPGLLGHSTRGEVAAEIAAVDEANAALTAELQAAELATIPSDGALYGYGVKWGASIFANNCSQCHGRGAAGVQASGYPNLLDDAWLWGGSREEIAFTVEHGIRNDQSPDTRWSEMPAYGEILSAEEIEAVVHYVRDLSGQEHDASLAATGGALFADNCAACHGEKGEGVRELGAPNLSDAIWLYGGSVERLTETVTNARFGVMPAWAEAYRGASGLTTAEIKAVSLYVHQLGGGE